MLRTAVAISARVMTAPRVKVTWRKGRRRATLLVPDARVEEPVGEVDGEVDDDDDGGDEQRHALHHREVAGADGAESQAAEAGQREHGLQHDGAGHQLT